jgi:hypothetical protein
MQLAIEITTEKIGGFIRRRGRISSKVFPKINCISPNTALTVKDNFTGVIPK